MSKHHGKYEDDTRSIGPLATATKPTLRIPGYDILREIYQGGQGIVYLAIQESTKRRVAIKILRNAQRASEKTIRRFEREIELVAGLNHANIVAVFDSGRTADGCRFCVMDYISGVPFTKYVRDRSLSISEALDLFTALCDAVSYAHRRGVIHRDLKPSNVLVTGDGNVKVLDFGLAKSLLVSADTLVTTTGQFFGTLPYMSPEQVRGNPRELDVRSDVYALGVMLYELLTGKFPYPVDVNTPEVFRHIVDTPPTSPSEAWSAESGLTGTSSRDGRKIRCPIDVDLETIVLKTLSKEKTRRYQSAHELSADLRHYRLDEPIEARRDSVAYLVAKRCRSLLVRHPGSTFLSIVILSTLVTQFLGVPLIFRWTPANKIFERWVTTSPPLSGSPSTLDGVKVIGLTDTTDISGIAEREELEDVSVSNVVSLRRMHGRLMQKLAVSNCRVVAWNITFEAESPYDVDFIRGVEALRGAGTEVIVGVWTWWLDEPRTPTLSPAIARSGVRYGCLVGRFGHHGPWTIQVAAQRGLMNPLPSLCLAATAAFRHPNAELEIHLDARSESMDMLYWIPDPTIPQAKRYLDKVDHVALTATHIGRSETGAFDGPFDPFNKRLGLNPADKVGFFHVRIPPNDVLDDAMVEYGRVLTADVGRLRDWFSDKIVVVADIRGVGGQRPHADGRQIHTCFGHAAAIGALLNNVSVRMPRLVGEWLLPLIGAVVGCLSGIFVTRGMLSRMFLVLAWIAFVTLASFVAYARARYLFNPLVLVFSFVVAYEIKAVVRLTMDRHRPI